MTGLDWTHTFDNCQSVVISKCVFTFLQSFLGYSFMIWLAKYALSRFLEKLVRDVLKMETENELKSKSFRVVGRTRTVKCAKLKELDQSVQNYCFSLSNTWGNGWANCLARLFLNFFHPFMADFKFPITIVSEDGCSRDFKSRNLAKLN